MLFSWLRNLTRRHVEPAPKPSSRRAPRRARLHLEALEDRTVLSTISVASGLLDYVAGASVNDNLTIAQSGSTYTFSDTADTIALGSGTAGFSGGGTHAVTAPAASFHGIELFFGASSNDVTIRSTAVNVSVNDSSGTSAVVDITVGGASNGAQGVTGTVADLTNSSSTVTVDDSADTTGRSATISSNGLSGLLPAPVELASSNLLGFDVDGGSGGNTFTITGTPANALTGLGTGTGNDTTYLEATGAGSNLSMDGENGTDVVVVGSNGPRLGGTLANIHGQLAIGNESGQTQLTVDDSGDTTANPNIQLNNAFITGLGTGGTTIEYEASDIGALNLFGGSGANTWTVASTGKSRVSGEFTTTIVPGSSTNSNTVNVQSAAAGTNLVIDGEAGNDTVALGSNGTLAGLTGMTVAVEAAGSGHMALTLNDSADTTAQTADLETVGPANNPTSEFLIPSYAPAKTGAVQVTFAPSQLSSLTVDGGSGGNTYDVSAFGNNLPTTLNTGTGNDTVNVQSTGTGTSLNIDGQAGTDAVNIGSKAPNLFGTLANVHGTVNVSNASGQTILTVDDSGDTTASNVQLTSSSITGLGTGGAVIDYNQAGIGVLNLFGGSGANTWTVLGTPKSRVTGEPTTTIQPSTGPSSTVNVQGAAAGTNLVINGQASNDTVNLGSSGSLAGLTDMTVAVEATSGGHMALTINDSADTAGQTADLQTVGSASNPVPEFLIPSYAPTNGTVQLAFASSQLSSLTIDGGSGNNTFNVSDFGAGLPTTINTGNGNDAVNITAASTSGYNLTMNGGSGSNSLFINDPSRASTFNPNPLPQNTGSGTEDFLSPGLTSTYTYSNMGSVSEKPDADHSFVQSLFHNVDGRSGSLAELDTWYVQVPVIGQAGVAAAFNHTTEAYQHVVVGWFQQFLSESPDANELTKYSGELANGVTQEHVLAEILATPEFLQQVSKGQHESPDKAYVEALYTQLLGIPKNQVTRAEIRQGLHELHRLGREGLAYQFLTSTAYRTLQVTADYERLLHRVPTSQELSDWVDSGLDLLSIQIGIESTPEFFQEGG